MTLSRTFEQLRRRGQLAFVPYQTAGFPSLESSLENLSLLADCGADILELGIPFSDPIADGPTIQYSSEVALNGGVRVKTILAALRETVLPCPVVLMSYLNPLMAYGKQKVFADMRAAGAAGLIVPDLALEEADEWHAAARAHEINLVFLIAPTSTDGRIRRIADLTDGFIYAVSLTGTTGARESLHPGLPGFLRRVKRITDKPLVVGFGISRPEHVRALRGLAEGIVVASRLVDAIRRGDDFTRLARRLKEATRS